jgi:superfamily II DNA or RNA helicase
VIITEKWLQEIGGWKAMKSARALAASGRVSSVEFTEKGEWEGLVKALTSSGGKPIACGLLIKSRTDITNLCSCPSSRRDGQICDHSLAAALCIGKSDAPATISAPVATTTPLAWQIEIPSSLPSHWQKSRIPVKATILSDGEPNPALTTWLATNNAIPKASETAFLSLDQKQASELFSTLSSLTENGDELRIGDMPLRMTLTVDLTDTNEVTLTLTPLGKDCQFLGQWIYLGDSRSLLPVSNFDQSLLTSPQCYSIPAFLDQLPQLESTFQLRSGKSEFLEKITIRTGQPRFSLQLEGSLNHLAGEVRCDYIDSSGAMINDTGSASLMPDPHDPLRFYSRDIETENAALLRLREIGFAGPDKNGQFALRGENHILQFFAGDLVRMRQDPLWDITIGERFAHVTRNVQRVTPTLSSPSSGEDWFAFELRYTGGADDISPADITRLLQTGQSSIKRPNGTHLVVDADMAEDLRQVMLDCHPDQSSPGKYRIPAAQASYVEQSIAVWSQQKIPEPAPTIPCDFGELETILRDYQKEGAQWIFNHVHSGHGVILADEMGLGKTLQTLTVIAALKANTEDKKPSLVVCPASLLHNWQQEAQRFVPHLKTAIVHGSDRETILTNAHKFDILITSYALIVRDADTLADIQFDLTILDEASAIRNPSTKAAKAAVALAQKSGGRIALTGTPVENSIRDLWSIMHFAMPRYMGTAEEFRERYEQPIAQSPETAAPVLKRLRRRLAPYLLRRTKNLVAKELPEKIETVRRCELTPAQSEVYRQFLDKSRAKMDDLLRTQGFGKARMQILATLLRLRQICCDLRLLEGFDKRPPKDSGKLNAFSEIIDEAIDGGHRVLVFSQFVSMLSLLRIACDARETPYAYIDGSTTPSARAAQVDIFQNERKTPIFLISLKAGGYGLNLTAADTVIHYDPWWNPAVEAQATDRAHRIGQKNIVTSHKLITRGTIEERILSLQRRKRNVIDAALDDNSPMMRGLSQKDIEEIMEL